MTSTPLNIAQETSFPWQLIMEATLFLWKDWPKEMQIVFVGPQNFNMTGVCPHCNRPTVLTQTTQGYSENIGTQHNSGYAINRVVVITQCQGCKKFVLGMAKIVMGQPKDMQFEYETHYPVGIPNEELPSSIPDFVSEDFKEAIRCHWVKSYRACVVMCRRALQTSANQFNAEGKNLVEQIDDLLNKGIITVALKDFAHEIRLTGNIGAHGADSLSDIKKEDAEDMMEFTREYLDHVYVMPAKLRARHPPAAITPPNP